ncbi:alpha-ribazole phosphatase family protein [Ghiorsea bivora]|uniref:alpha-ribazole phosphatase family protein n=1 Tax=Ghiorsea bivora TaxID=1485545 RepID=UPI00057160F8|nr:alpha-ribazole phosphatase family protein [Ghiorsea bivora]
MSPLILTIDILRHGETETEAGKLYGATDVPLSELGKSQLLKAAKIIHREPIANVISSPLKRCAWLSTKLDTRQHINMRYHIGFSEMDFGDWEGEDIQKLIQQEPNFRQDITQLKPPNGETFADFEQRVSAAWHEYITQHMEQGGHHLLVTHGGVIRLLLGQVLQIPKQHLSSLYIPHAAWSRITFVQGESPMLWFMNHHA